MPLIPEPAGLPDGFPSAWRGAALSAWAPAGHVPQAQAWLELDLDAELSFHSSLLVVAGQQLWWVPQEGGSPKAKGWMLQQGMELLHNDHNGVGTLELVQGGVRLAV